MLNNIQDRRSIYFVAVSLGLLIIPVLVSLPGYMLPFWLLTSCLGCFISNIINHNHMHHSVFHKTVHNIAFGVLLTWARGHSSSGIVEAHNHNHHVHNGGHDDWIRPELSGTGPGFKRLNCYVWNSILSMARNRGGVLSVNPGQQERRLIRIERVFLGLFTLTLLVINPIGLLIFVLIPWVVGAVLLVGVNLLQHDECEPASSLSHSRNFTGKLGNWLFFNNGYHTAHHIHPGLHWSLLPDYHHTHIAHLIEAKYEQASLIRFLTSQYLFRT